MRSPRRTVRSWRLLLRKKKSLCSLRLLPWRLSWIYVLQRQGLHDQQKIGCQLLPMISRLISGIRSNHASDKHWRFKVTKPDLELFDLTKEVARDPDDAIMDSYAIEVKNVAEKLVHELDLWTNPVDSVLLLRILCFDWLSWNLCTKWMKSVLSTVGPRRATRGGGWIGALENSNSNPTDVD